MGLVHVAHCRDDTFQPLSPAAKAELVRSFLDLTGAPQWPQVWAEARWEGASGVKKAEVCAKTILLTYNGDFGSVPVESLSPHLLDLATTCGQLRFDLIVDSCGLTK